MKRHFYIVLLITAMLLPTAAFAQAVVKITPAEKTMASAITASQLSDYLHFVASDAMEGRDTPSRGLDTTAEFLKMMLKRWGFKPAGDDGTFFQKIALKVESVEPVNNTLQIGGRNFDMNADFFRMSGNGSANGPMVFAKDGWMVRSRAIDAFQGVDVKDKIVVIHGDGFPDPITLTSAPYGVTPADLSGVKGTDWADPLTYAKQKGAKGIIVAGSPQLQPLWGRVRQLYSRESMYPEKLLEAAAAESTFPVVLVSTTAGDAIFAGESAGKDAVAAFTINKTASIATSSRAEIKWTQNVVALWEGRDPILKNEMVAIGAHYDHVGVQPNAPGPDKIWNGADDDGSGTVAVLAIAEALAKAKQRPKRSILFVWHAGEEKGLWGSEYFNKFPTVDIKKVVTALNIDMIGRSKKADDTNPKNKDLTGERGVYVIGSEMMSSTLGAITKQTNDTFLKLTYDYKYDDPKDTNRFFYRSDHYNYAMNGIPIVFWFDGVHEDYHGPGDHPDKIDYAKMEKVTRTIFLTLWEVSDLLERPKVDKQLPPELTQR